jgi:hypothetical protein
MTEGEEVCFETCVDRGFLSRRIVNAKSNIHFKEGM